MPNHGGNLQHHHSEQSMKHSSYKKREIEKRREKDKKRKERKKHHFPMVNKKIAEMLIVCLPCHFDYGKAPVSCARGTLLAVLNDTHVLTMTRTFLGPKLSMHEEWPSYSRNMRLPTYISSSIYSIFVHFNLNHLKMPIIGAMRA